MRFNTRNKEVTLEKKCVFFRNIILIDRPAKLYLKIK
jgi:hypothetical protein